jgi:glycosyltransferase involved in cell wall biosynthesis
MKNKLSVVITTYRRPNGLAETLRSLAAQVRQPDEVIVSDNASGDGTAAVVKEAENKFKKLWYNENPCNLGMPANLNIGVKLATGDLIANLHDADEFCPTLLQKWEQALIDHPSAGLVFCGLDASRKGGRPGALHLYHLPAINNGRQFFQDQLLAKPGSPIWGTVMARKSVYQRHMPFDSQFRDWADVDMWMRICSTHDIAYVNEPLIILDNSKTQLRRFSWVKFVIVHRMAFVNCHRIAQGQEQLMSMLRKQMKWTQYCFRNHLMSRLARLEIRQFLMGLRLMSKVLPHISSPDFHIERSAMYDWR